MEIVSLFTVTNSHSNLKSLKLALNQRKRTHKILNTLDKKNTRKK